MVKKWKLLKTLNTVVEYQVHMQCECDGISFISPLVSWKSLHPELGAVHQFVHCYCILYMFCMLAEGTFSWMGLPEDGISEHRNTLVTEGDRNMMHGIYNVKLPVCSLLRQSKFQQNYLFSVIITWMPVVYTFLKTYVMIVLQHWCLL